MWHKPWGTFHPWCICIKTRCVLSNVIADPFFVGKCLFATGLWEYLSFARPNAGAGLAIYLYGRQLESRLDSRALIVLNKLKGIKNISVFIWYHDLGKMFGIHPQNMGFFYCIGMSMLLFDYRKWDLVCRKLNYKLLESTKHLFERRICNKPNHWGSNMYRGIPSVYIHDENNLLYGPHDFNVSAFVLLLFLQWLFRGLSCTYFHSLLIPLINYQSTTPVPLFT